MLDEFYPRLSLHCAVDSESCSATASLPITEILEQILTDLEPTERRRDFHPNLKLALRRLRQIYEY